MAKTTDNYLYQVNDKPPLGKSLILGFQHVLALLAGLLSVPITFCASLAAMGYTVEATYMIQCSLFASGITTIVQCLGIGKIGAKLPISMGVDFTFIVPGVAMAARFGMAALMTAFIIGGLAEALVGSFLFKKLKKIFPPIVTGCVILTCGICLLATTVIYCGGGYGVMGTEEFGSLKYILVAAFTLVVILIFNRVFKGFASAASIFIGMIVGYALCIFLKWVSFSSLADYGWFSIPLPLRYGLDFNPTVILSVLVLYLVAISEFIGISSTTAFVSTGRDATEAEIRSGMICDGYGSAFSSLFNALPNTSYCNSLGVIAVTGVASRYVIAIAGAMLVVISFFPKISAVINLIPYPVLGAVMLVIVGGVVTSGIETLHSVKFTQRNLAIIGVTLAVGVGFGLNASALSGLPFLMQTLLSGIPGAAIVGLVLNLVCPRRPEDKVTDESTVTT